MMVEKLHDSGGVRRCETVCQVPSKRAGKRQKGERGTGAKISQIHTDILVPSMRNACALLSPPATHLIRILRTAANITAIAR